ncbi:DUF305 domain-containing protein [Amycolatopsis tucumanensis]|uniref:DUF305 domain-containing protein n=1 Tax=Amycolatopsis tucumanensis TaxID=401106 RepID=A0ABP7JX45_9PSEU|nr:DUF305 domain-containing protein [Amycolatopsis tucumanensis]MCF6429126.1 DUF305 domain-containing protein [Amycolatopsis tucumanensis]
MTSDDTPPPQRGRVNRLVLRVTALIAAVLVGAAGGLFLGQQSSRGDEPGIVDTGFAQDMSTHHLQAVQMATLARECSTDSAVRQLAFDIETSQLEQIGRMKGWLVLWGAQEQAPGQVMGWMPAQTHTGMAMPGAQSGALMPGMATSAELGRLRSLSGAEFDVFFLQLMGRHHQGGSAMASFAAQNATTPAVKTLAENIVNSQTAEVRTIGSMLSERNAQPLPAP